MGQLGQSMEFDIVEWRHHGDYVSMEFDIVDTKTGKLPWSGADGIRQDWT